MPSSFPRLVSAVLLGAALAGALAMADPPKAGFAPDPPVRASTKQWVIEVGYRAGKPSVERARAVTLDRPVGSARMMGRFAVELYIGKELLDRVRFNFPLTGDGPPEKSHLRPFRRPTFENVSTRLKVTIADNPRATYMVVIDRTTGASQRFGWPPREDGRLEPLDLMTAPGPASPVLDGGAALPDTAAQAPPPPDAGRD